MINTTTQHSTTLDMDGKENYDSTQKKYETGKSHSSTSGYLPQQKQVQAENFIEITCISNFIGILGISAFY